MESRYVSLLLLAVLFAWPAIGISQSSAAQSSGQEAITPTEISADLGGCSALITVSGSNGKPIFNAKVSTRIRYGMFGARKLDLEVYTSAAGQVKIIGLPESPKRPIFFQISKGEKSDTLELKSDSACQSVFDVHLK